MSKRLALLPTLLLVFSCQRHTPPATALHGATTSAPPSPRRAHEWLARQRGFPGGVAADAQVRARAEWDTLVARDGARRPAAQPGRIAPRTGPTTLSWTQIGPGPILMAGSQTPNLGKASGRVGAIAIDPTNAQVVYIGTSGGGVWKSSDGGATWSATTDGYAIGTLLIDPANHLTIWAGTGEGDASADSRGGVGVLKSTDGGQSWTTYAATTFAGASFTDMKLVGGNLYATVNSGNDGSDACGSSTGGGKVGFYKSIDGGQTWMQLLAGPSANRGYSSFLAVATNTFLLAAPYNGVYRWVEGSGNAPTLLTLSPPVAMLTGARLAATGTASKVYLGVGSGGTSGTLYVSSNAAAATPTFSQLSGVPNFCESQCDYDLQIAVDPTNDQTVFLGGSLCAVWKGTNVEGLAGATPAWVGVTDTVDGNGTPVTVNDQTSCDNNWASGVVHPDVHALVIDATGQKLYVGDDGGLAMTTNAGTSWSTPDDGLATALFYGVCVDPVTHKVYGGMQDNGSDAQGASGVQWQGIGSGDGGRCLARTSAAGGAVMVEVQEGAVTATTDGFATNATSPFDTNKSDCATYGTCTDRVAFVAPLAGDTLQPTVAYVGTHRLWRTSDFGATNFAAITTDLTAGASGTASCATPDFLTAIAVAPTNSDAVYTGSAEGVLHRVTQAGAATALTGAVLPARWVTDIAVDAHDDKTVYVAFSGFSANTPSTPGHIFKSTDAGATWSRADALPDSPVNALLAHPRQRGRLWAGTDFGVLESIDGGGSWSPIGTGMPNLPVTSFAFDAGANTLVAGTYGRSAWKLAIPPPAIASLAPPSGPMAGGTSIAIMGSGFQPGATVTIGGAAATVTSVSATAIVVTTPIHALGAVDVVVTNPDQQMATAAGAFTYAVPPVDMAQLPDLAQPADMAQLPDLAQRRGGPDMRGHVPSKGCSCEVGGAGAKAPSGMLLFLFLALAVLRRRARGADLQRKG